MGFLQVLVAMCALYLFLLFVVQPFLIVCRVLGHRSSESRRRRAEESGPDDVDPLPILDTKELPSFYTLIGRDRFRRMIFRSQYDDGRMGYYYLDKEASEARRLKAKRDREEVRHHPDQDRGPRLELGWKGFDANSSAWEILGVARDASIKEIKAAYRRLITKFHPDRYQNLSAAEIADLERDTKLIHAAYAKLAKS